MPKIMQDVYRGTITGVVIFIAMLFALHFMNEKRNLARIVERFKADTRVAEILVTQVNYDEKDKLLHTTIKFLEYDSLNKPLESRYYTFSGNVIQFQSLVVRFDDTLVMKGDRLKGRSAYLFWKVFMLDGANTKEFALAEIDEIPEGYKVKGRATPLEKKIWANIWKYVKNPKLAGKLGIKNIQIEAPGTMFVPGILYTLKIEHDGGMRIDSNALPAIVLGEALPLPETEPAGK